MRSKEECGQDDQRSKKVNEAAQKFAEALTEPYKAHTGLTVSARSLDAELTQDLRTAAATAGGP